MIVTIEKEFEKDLPKPGDKVWVPIFDKVMECEYLGIIDHPKHGKVFELKILNFYCKGKITHMKSVMTSKDDVKEYFKLLEEDEDEYIQKMEAKEKEQP